MHDHPHHSLNYKRNRRISSFSTSFEGLFNMPFMDNHCTHITGTLGTSLEMGQMDSSATTISKSPPCSSISLTILSPLQVELDTINDMYNSCKPTIISAINPLNTDPSFDGHMHSNTHHRRSLLSFLGNTLRWLTGTATTKDVNSIKQHVNQLTETQSIQLETLVHIVSILNVTRYAVQVNRHSIKCLNGQSG